MSADTATLNAYRFLGVHPSAPDDLVNAAYWMTATELQRRRAAGEPVDTALYAITRCYELVANPEARAKYDTSLGLSNTPVMVRPLSQIRRPLLARLFGRPNPVAGLDCYEMIGLDCATPAWMLPDAYRIMRDHYLKAPDARRRLHLLSLLDEVYAVLSDQDRRRRYDERQFKHRDRSAYNSPVQQKLINQTHATEVLDEKRPERVLYPPPAVKNGETSASSRLNLATAVATTSRYLLVVWRPARTRIAAAFRFAIKSITSRKDSLRRIPNGNLLQRPASRKAGEIEEAFLERLATRVGQEEHPEDSHAGD